MAEEVTTKESTVTKDMLQLFMRKLCTRPAEDIEKVLLHLLDTSRNKWNRKATECLRQLKDKDLEPEALLKVKAEYTHAFQQAHLLGRMRFGVSKTKRPLGGPKKEG